MIESQHGLASKRGSSLTRPHPSPRLALPSRDVVGAWSGPVNRPISSLALLHGQRSVSERKKDSLTIELDPFPSARSWCDKASSLAHRLSCMLKTEPDDALTVVVLAKESFELVERRALQPFRGGRPRCTPGHISGAAFPRSSGTLALTFHGRRSLGRGGRGLARFSSEVDRRYRFPSRFRWRLTIGFEKRSRGG